MTCKTTTQRPQTWSSEAGSLATQVGNYRGRHVALTRREEVTTVRQFFMIHTLNLYVCVGEIVTFKQSIDYSIVIYQLNRAIYESRIT